MQISGGEILAKQTSLECSCMLQWITQWPFWVLCKAGLFAGSAQNRFPSRRGSLKWCDCIQLPAAVNVCMVGLKLVAGSTKCRKWISDVLICSLYHVVVLKRCLLYNWTSLNHCRSKFFLTMTLTDPLDVVTIEKPRRFCQKPHVVNVLIIYFMMESWTDYTGCFKFPFSTLSIYIHDPWVHFQGPREESYQRWTDKYYLSW